MTSEDKHKIAELKAMGYGYKKIGSELGISANTVKTYLRRCTGDTNSSHTKGLCKYCGSPVKQLPHRKEKLFCSDKCRLLWWTANSDKAKKKHLEKGQCLCCGKEFYFYPSKPQKYCSRTCYNKFRAEVIEG